MRGGVSCDRKIRLEVTHEVLIPLDGCFTRHGSRDRCGESACGSRIGIDEEACRLTVDGLVEATSLPSWLVRIGDGVVVGAEQLVLLLHLRHELLHPLDLGLRIVSHANVMPGI